MVRQHMKKDAADSPSAPFLGFYCFLFLFCFFCLDAVFSSTAGLIFMFSLQAIVF